MSWTFSFPAPDPCLTDLFIHFHQVACEMAQTLIFRDVLARLRHKRFRNNLRRGLALHVMSERPRGAMARLVRLSAMAIRFAALAVTLHQTSRPQITQVGELPFQTIAVSFEFGERCGHMGSFCLTVYHTVRPKASPQACHTSPKSNHYPAVHPLPLCDMRRRVFPRQAPPRPQNRSGKWRPCGA